MPLRETAPIGAPCWVDLFTSDPDKSRAFYGDLFGWKAEEPNEEFGGYFNFVKDGVLVAGGMRNDGASGTPDGWNVHLATDAARAEIVDVGGTIVQPAQDTPYGRLAQASDSTGALFTLVAGN